MGRLSWIARWIFVIKSPYGGLTGRGRLDREEENVLVTKQELAWQSQKPPMVDEVGNQLTSGTSSKMLPTGTLISALQARLRQLACRTARPQTWAFELQSSWRWFQQQPETNTAAESAIPTCYTQQQRALRPPGEVVLVFKINIRTYEIIR